MTSKDQLEPYLMSLLASRLSSISVQMNNVMVKSARTSVLAVARDGSTAICDGRGDTLTFPLGFPVHVGAATLSARSLKEIYGDDIRPGDAFLHNSPYHGNTHPADHTILVPVFYEDELLFITYVKGHQADIGNSIPSTYHAKARDVYEEGALIFPCIRVQRDYRDVDEIIRMAKMRIRVPEVWYGDYSAMVGGARIGERELLQLTEKYGKATIKAFCRQYHEYGRQRMIEQIRTLPAGSAHYEMHYDPIPDILPQGVRIRVTVTVDPKEGIIVCDYTENDDSQPCGMNLCEATLTAAARTAVLNRLGIKAAEFPSCEGALERIVVKMREGSIIGKAKHPFSSSLATNNVNDRAGMVVMCALNQITDRLAMAEPHLDMGISLSVISGTDARYDDRPYVTQLISGTSGGPGMNGRDGYLYYMFSTGGLHYNNSVEMIERNYPILYMQQEYLTDALGAGKWDGGPAVRTVFGALGDPVTFIWVGDGYQNRSKGTAGGSDGVPVQAYLARIGERGALQRVGDLPAVHEITIRPGEAIDSTYSSSGGYGDPLERDPDKVRHRVREEWISVEMARDVYGVVVDTGSELYAVDREATEALRRSRKARGAGGE